MVLYLQAFFTLARDIKLKMDKKLVSLYSKIKFIVLVLNDAFSDENLCVLYHWYCKSFQPDSVLAAFHARWSLTL